MATLPRSLKITDRILEIKPDIPLLGTSNVPMQADPSELTEAKTKKNTLSDRANLSQLIRTQDNPENEKWTKSERYGVFDLSKCSGKPQLRETNHESYEYYVRILRTNNATQFSFAFMICTHSAALYEISGSHSYVLTCMNIVHTTH